MLFQEFFEDVYSSERNLRSESIRQLAMSVRIFVDFIGRNPHLDELNHKSLNDWVSENPRNWSAKTLKRRVCDILSIWSYAYSIEATENKPNRMRIRKPRSPRKIPDAWTLEQLKSMMMAAESFGTYMPNGVRKSDLLKSIILVGYHTVLRPSDVARLLRSQLVPDGEPVPMEKRLGDEVLVRTPNYVVEFIDRQYPKDVTKVFAWPYRREHFYQGIWKPMLRKAGLPDTKRDGLQKLRRTGVSHGESIERGYGASLAGHRPGSRVTYDSYVDPRVVDSERTNRLPRLLL